MGDVTGLGKRSLGALLPPSFLKVARILGLPEIDLARASVSFSFHRQRRDGVWGWATYLHIDRLTICEPCVDGLPFPRHRVEAERWVVEFCGRIGIQPLRNVEDEVARRQAREAIHAREVAERRAAIRIVQGSGLGPR